MAEIIHGDALRVLADLPDNSVDAVITDPPYSSGGMMRGDRTQDVHTKYVNSDSESGTALAEFTGDNRDQRAYGYWSALWMGEALRVTKPGGVLAVFTDWRQLPTTTDAIQAGGWVWRGIVPWYKPNGRRVQGRFANNCEYVIWGTSGPRDLAILPVALTGFYQVNTPREREHITQKPLEIMRSLVRICPAGGGSARPVRRLRHNRRCGGDRGPRVHRRRDDRALPPGRTGARHGCRGRLPGPVRADGAGRRGCRLRRIAL